MTLNSLAFPERKETRNRELRRILARLAEPFEIRLLSLINVFML